MTAKTPSVSAGRGRLVWPKSASDPGIAAWAKILAVPRTRREGELGDEGLTGEREGRRRGVRSNSSKASREATAWGG